MFAATSRRTWMGLVASIGWAAVAAQARTPAPRELVLTGRVVGLPTGTKRLIATSCVRDAHHESAHAYTIELDPRGRFRTRTLRTPSGALDHVLLLSTERDAAAPLGARIEWKAEGNEGEHELGEIALEPAPLLVAGSVRGADGERIAGASLSVHMLLRSAKERDDPDGAVHWRHRIDLEGRSDGDGRFEVRGFLRADDEELLLRVSHRDIARFEQRVRVGAREVVLAGERGRSFRVDVLVDEGVPRQLLRVQLEPAAPASRRVMRVLGADETATSFDQLEPGEYALRVYATDQQEHLAPVQRVRVGQEGGSALVDLRGALRVMRVRFVDDAAQPIDASLVRAQIPGSRTFNPMPMFGAPDNEICIVTAREALDLRIDSSHWRRADVPGLDGDRTVVLGPPLAVDVQLVNRPDWLPADAILRIGLTGRGPADGLSAGSAALDGSDVTRLTVRAPGPYCASVALGDATHRPRAFAVAREEWLVLDQATPQFFSLTIDEEHSTRLRTQWER